MPNVRIMAWNIQIFGPSKCSDPLTRTPLIAFIGEVVRHYNVHALAICEIRGDWGSGIGDFLKDYLCTAEGAPAGTWDSEPSVKFINGFHEQYLFVWDTRQLGLYGDSFRWDFHTAAAPAATIGFPRQKTGNRAPFLAYFESVATPGLHLPCAMFHAPNPSEDADIRSAFQNMSTASEMLTPTTDSCLVMGDTNVQAVANSQVAGSNGAQTFGPMVAAGFTQLIPGAPAGDVLTSLKATASRATVVDADAAYSEPYDTMLFRAPAAPAGVVPPPAFVPVTTSLSNRCNLIADCTGANPLGPFLRTLHVARDPASVPAAPTYVTAEDAFVPFRQFVSDHVPVITQLDW